MTWTEARYEDDLREGLELRIAVDDQGDVYVSVLPVGHKIGPTVRLCSSGGADRVCGLLPALRDAYEAITRHRHGDPDCEGSGNCHGPMKWCDTCGDVSRVCDMLHCSVHDPEELDE